MLMHAIAHWDCTDTVTESALEADRDNNNKKQQQKNTRPHEGLEPTSVLLLAARKSAVLPSDSLFIHLHFFTLKHQK